jgi:hypothetical protein
MTSPCIRFLKAREEKQRLPPHSKCVLRLFPRSHGLLKLSFGPDFQALPEQFCHDVATDVGQAKVAALEAVGKLGVFETQQVQDRCL